MANQPTKYRKFLAGAASAALVATAVVPTALAASFSDVSENNSHKEHIDALAAKGIITGYTDGTFGPNDTLTRSHVVKMMGKWLVSLGYEVPADYKTKQRFSDVSLTTKDEELLKFSALVKDNGVFIGKDGKLDPSGDITRENMAIVLVRAFDTVNKTDLVAHVSKQTFTGDVTDKAAAKAEARPYIDVLDFYDITNPAAPQFNPKGDVTRGQFASFLNKTINTDFALQGDLTAVNGQLTYKFSGTVEGVPTAADFTVTRTINGGTPTTIVPTVIYDEATKTATLTVPTVAQTDVAQTVTYSVKYKNEAAKTASFVIAAPTETASVLTAGTSGTDTVYVFFNTPVDSATATDVGNYRVDRDSAVGSTDPIVTPSRVTLNSTAVGSYGANQVATLTFPSGTLSATAGNVRVANVKSNGVVIPTTTVAYNTATGAADATAPTFGAGVTVLTDGLATPAIAAQIHQGKDITVTTTAVDAANFVVGGQYRVLKADGSVAIGWTKMDATNSPYDNTTEGLKATIKTNNLTVGTYTVQVRAFDAATNVSATATANSTATLTVLPANGDVTAPGATTTTYVNYSNFAVTGAQAQGARTVRVEGSVTDTSNLAAATAGVAKVEYRVRTYNTRTGAYTTSTNWTNANATDGAFGGATESYFFVTPALTIGSSYVIDVRATDVYGNVGPIVQANDGTAPAVNGTVNTATTPGLAAPIAGTFTIEGDSIAPVAGVVAPTGGFILGTHAAPSSDQAVRLASTTSASDNTVVTGVEFAVYRLSGAGSRELVRGFSSAGVTPTDGTFNSASEAYSIAYNLPDASGEYIFEIVAIDAAGNRSAITTTSTVSHVLDINGPTAGITPNYNTAENKNDFIVTFNESVIAADNTLDATEFVVVNQLGTPVRVLTADSTLTATAVPNQYILNVGGADRAALVAGNTLTVRGITDLSGNPASGGYQLKSTDLE